ncbi:hypothetical protein [Lactobacillus sp.]|uniref:hypothetical protein n=1 Tax=Lactobacillus sp. TaxID=1591 RepID=UPI003EF983B4
MSDNKSEALAAYLKEHLVIIKQREDLEDSMPLILGGVIDHEQDLREQLDQVGPTFQEYLWGLIKEKGMKNSEVYRGANISKQHFSKLMAKADYHPSKNTVCALAIGFKLNLDEAEILLEVAGYSLSKSSRFDLAVEYFLKNRLYNIVEDNILLDQNDLEQLGTQ